MEDQVQVLSVLYDDGVGEVWDQYGDESKVYAPYVKECMMCPANKDDVRKSFDHPHKCHRLRRQSPRLSFHACSSLTHTCRLASTHLAPTRPGRFLAGTPTRPRQAQSSASHGLMCQLA